MRNLLVGRRGFTLVELMVSIAMVMVLIAGVYAVFDAATKTTGVGIAVGQFTRAVRSLEQVMHDDFSHAVSAGEMPCIVIYSEQVFAYADRKDMDSDKGGGPGTADLGGTGMETPLIPAIYNTRSHRIDQLGFFVQNSDKPYVRQTGRPGSAPLRLPPELLSQGSSREAWIWYGLLKLPDNGNAFADPGEFNANQNPNNYFANDWCLGRVAMLLVPYIASPGNLGYIPFNRTVLLSPLGSDSRVAGGRFIGESRFDVAETSIADFRSFIVENIAANNLTPVDMRTAFDYRFNCKPQVRRSGNIAAMADEIALTVPFLERGVTQFIVEFAGDFMEQEWDVAKRGNKSAVGGRITAAQPDGEIDFLARTNSITRQTTRQTVKEIRWYGMPRNVDLFDDAKGPVIRGTRPGARTDANSMLDVVPVRDVYPEASDFEHFVDASGSNICGAQKTMNYAAAGAMPAGAKYVCTWTPQMLASGRGPWMIRITMTITDPNGRLPEGQTVQYVFSLPH
ncbi:MAG: prepilin-type N-terminal cleavage/methylation domain-containing protein [Planctomycetota bacterium]|nr:prepilin-type N-terminal cleavage/methylation domain-containing protein [Planctomycetota bacterium]